jgi:hypothetical protein
MLLVINHHRLFVRLSRRAVWLAQKASVDAEERRRDEVQSISNRVQLGSAYKLMSEVVAAKTEAEKNMYEQIAKADNSLNRQLQLSEKSKSFFHIDIYRIRLIVGRFALCSGIGSSEYEYTIFSE